MQFFFFFPHILLPFKLVSRSFSWRNPPVWLFAASYPAGTSIYLQNYLWLSVYSQIFEHRIPCLKPSVNSKVDVGDYIWQCLNAVQLENKICMLSSKLFLRVSLERLPRGLLQSIDGYYSPSLDSMAVFCHDLLFCVSAILLVKPKSQHSLLFAVCLSLPTLKICISKCISFRLICPISSPFHAVTLEHPFNFNFLFLYL